MKIQTTNLLSAICCGLLAMAGHAHGYAASAVLDYDTSGNYVEINSPVYNASRVFGIRFWGDDGISNNNTVINYSVIAGGTVNATVSSGIYFNGAGEEQASNGNLVVNYGTIGATNGSSVAGIYFNASNNGDTINNVVENYGLIQVTGSLVGAGIGFTTQNATSATNNVIINNGIINVATGYYAYGIGVDAQNSGDGNNNTFINRGLIQVAAPVNAIGIAFTGWNYGSVSNNYVLNDGTILVTGPGESQGIYFNGGSHGNASNNLVVNTGGITVSGSKASGIEFYGTSGTANNNTIINWGNISVSSGGYSILITNGTNNNIVLAGHSSVNGMIAASGSNNTLTLAFTGVNSAAANNLVGQLNAITALSGTATSGTFTFRGVTYTYDPLTVTLSLSSYQAQGRTPNQRAVGASLDSFTYNPTGDMLRLLNALDWSGNVPAGLEQLSPQRYQIYGDIALANADFVTSLIDRRLNNLRSGSESFDTTGLGVTGGSVQSKLGMADHKQIIGTPGKDSKEIQPAPEAKRWGAFLSGEVAFTDRNNHDWLQDSKSAAAGLLAGIDAKLTDTLTAGLLASYTHTNADLDNQDSSADVDTYGTGLYAGYHQGNFYGNGLAAYLRNQYDSSRTIDIPDYKRTANGRTSGNQYLVNLDGGYDQPVTKCLTAGPFAGLQYVHLDVNQFTESGAGAANLAINDQSLDSLRSRLGVRVELRGDLTRDWTGATELRAGWQHEFANNDRAIVSSFSGSGLGSFTVRTSDPERDAFIGGIGLNATYRNTLTTFVDYDVQLSNRYTEQIVKGGFKWSF